MAKSKLADHLCGAAIMWMPRSPARGEADLKRAVEGRLTFR